MEVAVGQAFGFDGQRPLPVEYLGSSASVGVASGAVQYLSVGRWLPEFVGIGHGPSSGSGGGGGAKVSELAPQRARTPEAAGVILEN